MVEDDKTCWTLIHSAAKGHDSSREEFARLYQPVARSYFESRWGFSTQNLDVDDAVQDVFVECFKSNGVLNRVSHDQPEGFRRFFHGVLRNVALRRETQRPAAEPLLTDVSSEDASASRAFDRAWAQLILKEAVRLQEEMAAKSGERAVKRLKLLRLRFEEGLPIRDIAVLWNEDAAKLHHEYATAREEFSVALRQALAFQNPDANAQQIDVTFREFLQLLV
jgi:DNA-directed RNA polymerase specialized sigma24 family protein